VGMKLGVGPCFSEPGGGAVGAVASRGTAAPRCTAVPLWLPVPGLPLCVASGVVGDGRGVRWRRSGGRKPWAMVKAGLRHLSMMQAMEGGW
jgi:hypothetical protein